jgi:hypothetical protein
VHKNAMGQQCDGTLCVLCTRCSNCKYHKPGQYNKHEHVFRPVVDTAPLAAPVAASKPPRKTAKPSAAKRAASAK